jgi:DNA-binding FadR family transcriptional regulator
LNRYSYVGSPAERPRSLITQQLYEAIVKHDAEGAGRAMRRLINEVVTLP